MCLYNVGHVTKMAAVHIYLTTLPTLPIEFCYTFKTTQDIELKIAGTIERFLRRVLKANLYQQTIIKKRPGRLDTPHPIFKSHKTMYSEQRSLQQFLVFHSRFAFSFCHST